MKWKWGFRLRLLPWLCETLNFNDSVQPHVKWTSEGQVANHQCDNRAQSNIDKSSQRRKIINNHVDDDRTAKIPRNEITKRCVGADKNIQIEWKSRIFSPQHHHRCWDEVSVGVFAGLWLIANRLSDGANLSCQLFVMFWVNLWVVSSYKILSIMKLTMWWVKLQEKDGFPC